MPGRIDDGAVHGRGASDMKGGVAVAMELCATSPGRTRAAVDVALLLFGREELPAHFSPLPELFERSLLVHAADLALLLEPTDRTVQAGCLGSMNGTSPFRHERSLGSALDSPTTQSSMPIAWSCPDRLARAAAKPWSAG